MHFSPPLLIWFELSILISVLAMKLSSLKTAGSLRDAREFFFLSPVFSTISWKKRRASDRLALRSILIRGAFLFPLFATSWGLYLKWVPLLKPGVVTQSYLALVPVYLLGQLLSTVLELLYLPTGWHFPAHFQFPPLSRSVADFWGNRWGTWVADWLRQMVFLRCRRKPVLGLFFAFLLSGIWHELLLDVPFFLFFGVNLLGWWTLYFMIQALGIWGERKFFRSPGLLHWIYTWSMIVLPAPLAINEGALRTFGLFIG